MGTAFEPRKSGLSVSGGSYVRPLCISASPELVARISQTSNLLPNIAPNWNTAPSQNSLVVRRHPEIGERHLDALK